MRGNRARRAWASPMEQFERVQRRPVEGTRGARRGRVRTGRSNFGGERVEECRGKSGGNWEGATERERRRRDTRGGVTQGALMTTRIVGSTKRRWKREEEDTVLPTMVNYVTEGREVGVMEMVGPMSRLSREEDSSNEK
jgi:hypothetical protein